MANRIAPNRYRYLRLLYFNHDLIIEGKIIPSRPYVLTADDRALVNVDLLAELLTACENQ